YPGIDQVYYSTNQHQLEYDFVVAPGASPGTIRLAFTGVPSMSLDAQGHLHLTVPSGEVVQQKPALYQLVNGTRRAVSGGYVLLPGNQVGFQVGAYDTTRPLYLDPVLSYSTFLGGSGNDVGFGIAVDEEGNAYITGQTGSSNFPTTDGSVPLAGGAETFVAKL